MGRILPFLAVLIAVAFFTKTDIFFYLLYTMFGVYILGRLWARRSLAAVMLERHHDNRIFVGESFAVDVQVRNRSWLPVLWLRLSDTVPSSLTSGAVLRQVVSLRPHERLKLSYNLAGHRRGYYRLGPLVGLGGDLLGTVTYESRQKDDDYVIVYPKIIALQDAGLPSQSPFGVLPSRERIFEDPARIRGVRDYQPGDSLRQMDWKTSARLGSLQVRRLEPAIALETAVFLNLAVGDYPQPDRTEAAERGIVIAASLAVHLVEKRQAVSLVTNGCDPLAEDLQAAPGLPLRRGRAHLMNVLDLLARIEVAPDEKAMPFLDLLGHKSLGLPWGSTVVVVTSHEVNGLLETLLGLRRRGLAITLILTVPQRGYDLTAHRAEQIGVHTLRIWSERDMDVWR
jgi:uncharacterized protein (DUF58 family)